MIAALVFVIAALGVYLFVNAAFEAAPTLSVTSNEAPNTQPAGPADRNALPGTQ
jgi:hypothetical protein